MATSAEPLIGSLHQAEPPPPPYGEQLRIMLLIAGLLAVAYLSDVVWPWVVPREQLSSFYLNRPWVFWVPWLLALPAFAAFGVQGERVLLRVKAKLMVRALCALGVWVGVFHARVLLSWYVAAHREGRPAVPWSDCMAENMALLPMDVLVLGAISACVIGVNRYLSIRQRAAEAAEFAVRAAKLESELVRAELAAYRGQLDPHFLFNSLNAVATLVRQQRNESAVETLAQLSGLLRLAAESVQRPEVPLAVEMDFIKRYLAIESLRFGRKLRVTYEVPDELLVAAVPNLLLQPLVENAIKHGIARRLKPGQILLRAERVGEVLRLQVVNDNSDDPRPPTPRRKSAGLGVPNVRARLHYLYGDNASLTLNHRADDATVVEVLLPWRVAPETERAAPSPGPGSAPAPDQSSPPAGGSAGAR